MGLCSFLLLIWVQCQIIQLVEGSGKIVTKFIKYQNPSGKRLDGYCCDKYWWGTGDCQSGDTCDPGFVICLGNITQSSSIESCEYGRMTTGQLTDNTNEIEFEDQMGEVDNPLVFEFKEWPGVVKLKIMATDVDGSGRYDIMDTFTYQHNQHEVVRELDASSQTLQLSGSRSSLDLELKVFCDPNYFGKDCNTYCDAQGTGKAHFMCDPLTGERICMTGYSGPDCLTNEDNCKGHDCYKGSTCKDGLDTYICVCPPGRTGTKCETEIDECASNPCQHGGTCRDEDGFYYCECPVGTLGDNCEIDISECESDPCLNNGTCVDEVNGFRCVCAPGFKGVTCGKDINECASGPCVKASGCIDLVGDYQCICDEGFTGKNCEENIDECASQPCQNRGLCLDGLNSYTCICRDGTSGKFCEINFNECESGPCQNGGSCVDHINSYSCDCPAAYTGEVCETEVLPCDTVPCKNGGTCTNDGDTYKCECYKGFTGDSCEKNINECASNPCQNGAFCMDLTGHYRCRCLPYTTGIHCENVLPSTTTSDPVTVPLTTVTQFTEPTDETSEPYSGVYPDDEEEGEFETSLPTTVYTEIVPSDYSTNEVEKDNVTDLPFDMDSSTFEQTTFDMTDNVTKSTIEIDTTEGSVLDNVTESTTPDTDTSDDMSSEESFFSTTDDVIEATTEDSSQGVDMEINQSTDSYEDSSELSLDQGSGEMLSTESLTYETSVLSDASSTSPLSLSSFATPTEDPLIDVADDIGSGEITESLEPQLTTASPIISTTLPSSKRPQDTTTTDVDSSEAMEDVGSGEEKALPTLLPTIAKAETTTMDKDFVPVTSADTLSPELEDGSGEVLTTTTIKMSTEEIEGSGEVSFTETTTDIADNTTAATDSSEKTKPTINPDQIFGNIEESLLVPEKVGSTLPLITFPDRKKYTTLRYIPPSKSDKVTSPKPETTTLGEDLESMATWVFQSLSTFTGATTESMPTTTDQEAGPPPPALTKTTVDGIPQMTTTDPSGNVRTTPMRGDISPEQDTTQPIPESPETPTRTTTVQYTPTIPPRPLPQPTRILKLPIKDNDADDKTGVIVPSIGLPTIRTRVYHTVKKAYNVGKKIADTAHKKAKSILRRTYRRLSDLWQMCVRGALRMVYSPYNSARNVYTTVVNRTQRVLGNVYKYAQSRVKKYYNYLKSYYRKTYNYYYTQYFNYVKNKWWNYFG